MEDGGCVSLWAGARVRGAPSLDKGQMPHRSCSRQSGECECPPCGNCPPDVTKPSRSQSQQMWWVSHHLKVKLKPCCRSREQSRRTASVFVPGVTGEEQAPAQSEELATGLCKSGPRNRQCEEEQGSCEERGYNLHIHT